MAVKTYDPGCYDLAAMFLHDRPELNTDANIHALALEIQQTISDEIFFMESEQTKKASGGNRS